MSRRRRGPRSRVPSGGAPLGRSRALPEALVDRCPTTPRRPRACGRPCARSADFGATWLLDADLQLDAALGFGLNDEAGDSFATVGVSHRF